MSFKKFQQLIEYLRGYHETVDSVGNILQPHIMENPSRLISFLLIEIYGEHAVSYVLDEYLRGNRTPVVFKKNGVSVSEPCSSIKELWVLMEKLKSPGEKISSRG